MENIADGDQNCDHKRAHWQSRDHKRARIREALKAPVTPSGRITQSMATTRTAEAKLETVANALTSLAAMKTDHTVARNSTLEMAAPRYGGGEGHGNIESRQRRTLRSSSLQTHLHQHHCRWQHNQSHHDQGELQEW